MSHLVGQHPAVPTMDCRYGAPLGRANNYVACSRFYVHRIRMISYSAYDEGGAYWGQGRPMYVAWNRDGLRIYMRASSAKEAREKATKELKKMQLWRPLCPTV
jgi:hypothetical protein